jgi:hypothetical protein
MKRMRLIIPVVVCLLLLGTIAAGLFGGNPRAPRFVPVQTQPTGPYKQMHYGWGEFAPVRDSKVWFWTVPAMTNGHIQHFLYDLKNRRVTGELLHANPVFANGDHTKLLCEGDGFFAGLKWNLIRWAQKFPFGKTLSQKVNYYDEVFWILDLRNNAAVKIGKISQFTGTGSYFIPSPGFRFGYNRPSVNPGFDVVVCDLESNRFSKAKIGGEPLGWWDEKNILFKDKANNFGLFDVVTGAGTNLFDSQTIAERLRGLGLSADTSDIIVFRHFNGHGNDILLTLESQENWGQSFLVEVDQTDLSLKLLYRDFRFQWGGHLDSDRTHYVYEGESGQPGKGGNGGVYLRNLTNNTTVTLVEPDNGGQYSLARFCDDGVIYWRKKLLWRVDLNGSNNAPLIPELAK